MEASAAVAVDLVEAVPREDGDMKDLSIQFLTQEDQQRVTEAVQRAEKQTSGEIVPMVVSASHNYPMASAIGSVFISLPLSLLLTSVTGSLLWLGPQNMWILLIYWTLLFFPMYYLVDNTPFLKRLFLLKSQVAEEVEEGAVTSFYSERLYQTRDENGILIFVSVLEKKVWILGGRGIYEKIDPDQWPDIIDELSAGIRENNQCDALCRAVDRVGTVLVEHFPIREDDKDELHNIIIR